MPESRFLLTSSQHRQVAKRHETITKPSPPPPPPHAGKMHAAGMPKMYDPGLATTLACKSSITYLNGSAGILRYRGYPIESLIEADVKFDEVAYLLLYERLPTRTEIQNFRASLGRARVPDHIVRLIQSFPTSAHPMTVLMSAVSALTASFPQLNPAVAGNDVYKRPANRKMVVHTVLGLMPILASMILHHMQGLPIDDPETYNSYSSSKPYTQRYFEMAFPALSKSPAKAQELIRALDTLLVLHADHEQNCSTSAVRHLSSSGVDVFSSLASGVAALYGPLHGGACEAVIRMLKRIGDVRNVDAFIARVKNRDELLMGFGHRVYRTYDPRAKVVRSLVRRVLQVADKAQDNQLIKIATALEQRALNDDFFVSRKLYPNIDFYSGIIYTCILDGPRDDPTYFGMFFSLGRIAGWLAHWLEFLDDKDRRIVRPYQWFTGPIGPLKVPSFDEREGDAISEGSYQSYSKL